MLNITPNMTSSEVLIVSHNYSTVPSLIIFFVSYSLLFLISGLLLIDNKRSGYSKFMWIWLLGTAFGAIVLFTLIYNPILTQNIKDFFLNFFN